MRSDLTVIYYTANRERPEFEERIRNTLVETSGGVPIISVSQKPIDLGRNICVGDVGWSVHNAYRQLQIGAAEASTRFVCTAESDMLYPREYFLYVPGSDSIAYSAVPIYLIYTTVVPRRTGYLRKDKGNEGAIIVNRDHLLRTLDAAFSTTNPKQWIDMDEDVGNEPYIFKASRTRKCDAGGPIVMFKTEENMHKRSRFSHNMFGDGIPYWGPPEELLRRYTS